MVSSSLSWESAVVMLYPDTLGWVASLLYHRTPDTQLYTVLQPTLKLRHSIKPLLGSLYNTGIYQVVH